MLLHATCAAQAQSGAATDEKPAEAPAATLNEVQVRGSRQSEVTERTGSYTTPLTSRATGLDLSLRETPQMVQVITSQQLQDRGYNGLASALNGAMGIAVSNDAVRPSFTARGFPVGNLLIDGTPMLPTYQATPGVQGDNMIAYDRIEIVHGANGLMSGAGEPSATVNMIRKRPTRDFQASVQAGFGSWHGWQTQADISGPFTSDGRVRGRLALGKSGGDSYVQHKGRDAQAVFATMEVDLAPRTTLRLGHHYDGFDQRGMGASSSVPLYRADGSLFNPPHSLSLSPEAWHLQHRLNNSFAELSHVLDNGWKLNGQLNYTVRHNFNLPVFKLDSPSYPDAAGGSTLPYDYVPYPLRETQSAYDLSASGQVALFGRNHDMAIGAQGWRRVRTVNDWVLQPSPYPDSFYRRFTIWDMNWSEPRRFSTTGYPLDKLHTNQDGVYGVARWNLADSVKLITGVRVSSYDQYVDYFNGTTGAALQSRQSELRIKHQTTPYAGAVVDVTRDLSLYASYADVFKPQSYYDAQDNTIAPIVGKSMEVGAKGSLLDGRLNAGATLFHITQNNNAIPDPTYSDTYRTPAGNRPYISSGSGNKVNGYELQVAGEVARGWNLMAGFVHAPVKRANGTKLDSNVPDDQFKLFTTYRIPLGAGAITVGGGVNWRSKINYATRRPTGRYAANGTPVTAISDFEQKSVATASALLRWQPIKQASIDLGVDNLFDKKYFQVLGGSTGIYGEPRRWRVTGRYEF